MAPTHPPEDGPARPWISQVLDQPDLDKPGRSLTHWPSAIRHSVRLDSISRSRTRWRSTGDNSPSQRHLRLVLAGDGSEQGPGGLEGGWFMRIDACPDSHTKTHLAPCPSGFESPRNQLGLLVRDEVGFAGAADRADPIGRDGLKGGAWRKAGIGIALGGVVDHRANAADPHAA